MQFNPWLFKGTSELLARFFGEVSAQLGRKDRFRNAARQLAAYGRTLAPLAPIPGAQAIANAGQLAIDAIAGAPQS